MRRNHPGRTAVLTLARRGKSIRRRVNTYAFRRVEDRTNGMTELIPDDQIVWAARRLAAELPSGEIRLVGVLAPMPEAIAAILREALESVAEGNSVSLIVRKRTAYTDPAHLADMLATDGKTISG